MGPTVAIWLPQDVEPPTRAQLLEVARSLDASAESITDFTIRSTQRIGGSSNDPEGRPFGFNVGDTGFEHEEEELRSINQAVGYVPSAAVHAFAHANSRIDHRILAELAIYFARTYQGLIDFGGNLGQVRLTAGQLFAIPYCAGSFPEAFHVSDAQFLEAWLTHDSFHMIK